MNKKKLVALILTCLFLGAAGVYLGQVAVDYYSKKQAEQLVFELILSKNKNNEISQKRSTEVVKRINEEYTDLGDLTPREFSIITNLLENKDIICFSRQSVINSASLTNKCIVENNPNNIKVHNSVLEIVKSEVDLYNTQNQSKIQLFKKINMQDPAEVIKYEVMNLFPDAVKVETIDEITDDYLDYLEANADTSWNEKIDVTTYLESKGVQTKEDPFAVPDNLITAPSADKPITTNSADSNKKSLREINNEKILEKIKLPSVTVNIYFDQKTRISNKDRSFIKKIVSKNFDNFDTNYIFIKSKTVE